MFAPIAKEVKNEILEKIEKGEKVLALSQQYGVSEKTIYTWLRKKALGSVSLLKYNQLKNENEQLKQIIGVLSLELAKTKKRNEIVALVCNTLKQINKSLVAKLIGIARAGLYKSQKDHQTADELLKEQILTVLGEHASYGHRRIALELGLGKKKIRRVMREYGIKPYKRKARWRKRRDERREPQPYPNLIKGRCPIRPGVILVGDFTHIIYQGKVLYLATFMDVYTREIVGWHIATHHAKELVLEALLDAIKTFGKAPTIVHTNQGSEYCSKEYLTFLQSLGIQISMSKKASPWENGYQESFYNNFKTDLGLEFDRFATLGELIAAIYQTINYYNKKRIHTKLKMSPVQFKNLSLKDRE